MEWISVIEEYLSTINFKRTTNGCLIPTNRKINSNGYISIKKFGFCKLHRLQMYYKKGVKHFTPDEWININRNKVVRHTCDNPSCCNPEHLLIGTQKDNVNDRVRRSRCAKMENNGNAKLTTKDVEFIRHYSNTHMRTEIADFLGVNVATVQRVIQNKNWMPLPDPPKEAK